MAVHPPSIVATPGSPAPDGSEQARLRRPKAATYRCFLPDLAGFMDLRRAGPARQRRRRRLNPEPSDL